MDTMAVFLCMFDDAWEHKWESLSVVLKGVTEEEAAWQAPCYLEEEDGKDWPLPGSIAGQVAHLAWCKEEYTGQMRSRGGNEAPAKPERRPCASFAEELRRFEAVHRAQRDAIAQLTGADLERKTASGQPLVEYLAMIIRHDIWHAGQIALARRLFSTRQVG
ncbi:MAG: DinB family protein [Planctomycetes bacterium]|nr:DinB family protein [Planctomycetota bacterium]